MTHWQRPCETSSWIPALCNAFAHAPTQGCLYLTLRKLLFDLDVWTPPLLWHACKGMPRARQAATPSGRRHTRPSSCLAEFLAEGRRNGRGALRQAPAPYVVRVVMPLRSRASCAKPPPECASFEDGYCGGRAFTVVPTGRTWQACAPVRAGGSESLSPDSTHCYTSWKEGNGSAPSRWWGCL